MKLKDARVKIFVEASAIAAPNISGIGQNIIATIRSLSELPEFTSSYKLVLLVPQDLKKNLEKLNFPRTGVEIKSIIIKRYFLDVLMKNNLLPPMDIFFGSGIYLFPNYRNWPLLFSKSITYIYDVAYQIFPETVRPDNLKDLKKNVPRWVRRSDLIITISKNSLKEIVRYLSVPEQKIRVVYCGVDKLRFSPQSENNVTNVKAKYGIKNGYILTVGNLEPRKNIDRLLEAYSHLPSALSKKYSLVIAGGGGWLNQNTVKKIGKLQEEGFKIIKPEKYIDDRDLPSLYSGASLFVHPAIHEGFGLPPLEALACKTPTVVSNIGALRETLGDSVGYFDPYSIESMKNTIVKAIEGKNASKLEIESEKVVSKFTWESTALQLLSCIKK